MRGALRSIEGDPIQYILYFSENTCEIEDNLVSGASHGSATGFGDCCLDDEVRSNQNTFWKRTRVEYCVERIFPERNSSALPVLYYLEQNFKRWSGKESVNIRPFINFIKRASSSISGSKHKRENNCSYSCHYQ